MSALRGWGGWGGGRVRLNAGAGGVSARAALQAHAVFHTRYACTHQCTPSPIPPLLQLGVRLLRRQRLRQQQREQQQEQQEEQEEQEGEGGIGSLCGVSAWQRLSLVVGTPVHVRTNSSQHLQATPPPSPHAQPLFHPPCSPPPNPLHRARRARSPAATASWLRRPASSATCLTERPPAPERATHHTTAGTPHC